MLRVGNFQPANFDRALAASPFIQRSNGESSPAFGLGGVLVLGPVSRHFSGYRSATGRGAGSALDGFPESSGFDLSVSLSDQSRADV